MNQLTKPGAWIQAFLRFFFKHLYTTLAWSYDFVANVSSIGQWRIWQSAGVECLPPGRALEIGFGTGHMLTSLYENGYDAFGVDPSKQMARIAARNLARQSLPKRLVRAKAQALPFKNNEFQSILSTFPSEYIVDDLTLKEAWRVLEPGGKFIVIPGVEEIFGIKDNEKKLQALFDELASILYRVTGEAIHPDNKFAHGYVKQLNDTGFSTDIQHIRQRRAVILRIIAQKIEQPKGLTGS
jgi:ubiquinone/menaquinone biosynthesis C-methylase UbiE